MQYVKNGAFVLSLLCVLAATILGISMVWSRDHDNQRWRWLVSTLIVFIASSATLSLAKLMDRRG